MGYLHGGLVDWEVTERWPIHAGGWLRMLLGSRRGCTVAACRDPLVSPSFSVKEKLLLLWVAACRDRTTLAPH